MTPSSDELQIEIERWLRAGGRHPGRLTPLAGDVSPRRYWRVELGPAGTVSAGSVSAGRASESDASESTAIAAYYPQEMRDTGGRFRHASDLLSAVGVPVPPILAWDPEAGIMLMGDAGRLAMHDAVAQGESPLPHWRQAVAILARMERLDAGAVAALNPPLDARLFRGELLQSWDLVLEPLGLVGGGGLRDDFRLALFDLCDRLEAAPARPCHRDFMARNLLLDRGGLMVIDHQDLRLGPAWYDLASLLNDTVYATPEQEAVLLDLARVPRPEREIYHRAAAQRALKIVGTFTAFAGRGVDRYLPLVPPSLHAAHRHLARLPETAPVMRDLAPSWNTGEPRDPTGLC